MNLYRILRKRAQTRKPIRVGVIGAGKFGSMFLAQAHLMEGIQVVGVADIDVQRASNALRKTGWPRSSPKVARKSEEISDAAAKGQVALTDNNAALIEAELDVIIECTGVPEAAVINALLAIEAGCHVVMVTVEADVLLGPLLYQRAKQAGVVYSLAYGDQPALICELVDWARTCGFEVVAAGKGTKYLPFYRYSTPETVFEQYGFSPQQVKEGDYNARMYNSFLDGTKSAIEMAAIANATGLIPQVKGLGFHPIGVGELAQHLKPKSDGGLLSRSGTVEVVSSIKRNGEAVENDLRWGVYVTFRTNNEYVKQCFAEYGLYTDRSGWYASLHRTHHLIGLELGVSVASAALRHEPTGSSKEFVGDVPAVAKRNLVPGDVLDGEGGYTVYGNIVEAPQADDLQLRPTSHHRWRTFADDR